MQHDAAQAAGAASFCRNADKRSSALLDTRLPEGFAADIDTVWNLVRKLHDDLDIPLSFIEDEADEPIALPEAEQTLEEVLRAVADRHERYRCEAFDGRLVLRSTDSVFDVTISGVNVVEERRIPARDAYIDHLRASDQRFKDWYSLSLWATAGGVSPVFEGRVTLSPRAPVVLHLVQLLGQDQALYFEVWAPGRGLPGRYMRLGAVRRPGERFPRPVPPPPKDGGPLKPFCRSDGKQASPWLAANPEIRLPGDVTTVGELIGQLRDNNAIPISWIEAQPHEPLRLEKSLSHLDDFLRSVAEQHPDYQCEVRSGRLILRPADEIFDRTISGVDVVDQYRFAALVVYINHLCGIGGGFENWVTPFRGGLLESPLFDEKITLAPKAPLLDHLIQLLGRLPNAYFTIPAPGEMPRTIMILETRPRMETARNGN